MKLNKKERKQVIRTIKMLAPHLLEYTPPEVKYSERNIQVGRIVMALDKLEKL